MKRFLIQFGLLSFAVMFVISSGESFSQNKRKNPAQPVPQPKPEWTFVCKDAHEGSAYYIKTDRIGRTPDKTILVWEKQNFLSPEDKGEYLVLLYEHDCTEGKSRNLQFTRYRKDGEVMAHWGREKLEQTESNKWMFPAPETVREAIFNAACKAASNDPK